MPASKDTGSELATGDVHVFRAERGRVSPHGLDLLELSELLCFVVDSARSACSAALPAARPDRGELSLGFRSMLVPCKCCAACRRPVHLPPKPAGFPLAAGAGRFPGRNHLQINPSDHETMKVALQKTIAHHFMAIFVLTLLTSAACSNSGNENIDRAAESCQCGASHHGYGLRLELRGVV